MKAIPIKELIQILESVPDDYKIIREDEIHELFKRYGDDYFREVSSWEGYELCKENELRKEWLKTAEELRKEKENASNI
jgi:hypothetical protein